MQSPWTEQILARASKLWREGKSAAEIGAAIGMTRMAVIGKMRRVGVSIEHPHLSAKGSAAKPRVRRPKSTAAATLAATAARRASGQPQRSVPALVVVEAPNKITPLVPGGVSIFDLRGNHCRWPLWESSDRLCGGYCGRPPHPGSPYCPGHTLASCSKHRTLIAKEETCPDQKAAETVSPASAKPAPTRPASKPARRKLVSATTAQWFRAG